MSVKLPKKHDEREIIRELHSIMDIFRTIFRDDKMICRNIDENYEKILISDIRLIPEQYDEDIMLYVNTVKLFVTNINYKNIIEGIRVLNPNYKLMGFEVNSYKGAELILNKIILDKTDRLMVTNILTKLRPLFTCVDKIFMIPMNVLGNIADLSNEKYADLI